MQGMKPESALRRGPEKIWRRGVEMSSRKIKRTQRIRKHQVRGRAIYKYQQGNFDKRLHEMEKAGREKI